MKPVLAGLLLSTLAVLACQEPVALAGDESSDPPVPVQVEGIGVDRETHAPVVVLETDDARRLPIWIGPSEARSIAAALEGARGPRPNTHDLARRLVEHLGGRLERVVVTKLERRIYYARMHLAGRAETVDARPSDAIAIALRMDAPLFVAASLFERQPESRDETEAPTERRASAQPMQRPPRHRQLRAETI